MPLIPSFVCVCGREFYGSDAATYVCRTCGRIVGAESIEDPSATHELQPAIALAAAQRAARRKRIERFIELNKMFRKSILRAKHSGEGFGDCVDRLEVAARKYGRDSIARRLQAILAECTCNRADAIARLNAESSPHC